MNFLKKSRNNLKRITQKPTLSQAIKDISPEAQAYDVQVIAKVTVGNSIEFRETNEKIKTGNLIFWSNTKPKVPTMQVASHFRALGILPENRLGIITEHSKDDVAIRDMYKFIHATMPGVSRTYLAGYRNTIVCIDPKHELPILLRMTWPKTQIACIFTTPPKIQPHYLSEVDCIISCPSLIDCFSEGKNYPMIYFTNTVEGMQSYIKAFHSIIPEPQIPFHYSVQGFRYDKNLLDTYDIVVMMKHQKREFQNKCTTFREYISDLYDNSDDVIIHSKWLYRLETYVSDENWIELIIKILNDGGAAKIHLTSDME